MTLWKFFLDNKNSISVFLGVFLIFSIINIHEMQSYEYLEKQYPSTASSLNLITGEEPYYLVVTSTIIRHHSIYAEDFFLDKNPDPVLTFPPEFHIRPADPGAWHAFQINDGHDVIGDGPGLSYLLIPGYLVGGIFGAFTTMSIASSFNSVLIFKFISKFTTKKIAFVTTMIFTFGTLLLIYSNQIYADVIMMLFFIFIIYAIFEKYQSSLYLAISGSMLGFGIFLKGTFFLADFVFLPLFTIFFIKQKISKKGFLTFVIFFVAFSFLAILNNIYSYHSLLGQENTIDALNFLSGKNAGILQYNYGNSSFHLDALLNTLFGTYNGLFIFSPVLLLFTFGFGPLWNKNRALLITISVLSLLVIAGYIITNPLGFLVAGDPPYRYLIPIVPLMSVPFAIGLQKFSRNIIYLMLLSILLLVSIAFSFGFTLMGRFSSLQHVPLKTEIINTIYGGIAHLFPTLGPTTWSFISMPENHPMNIPNIVFVLSLVFIMSSGILISYLKGTRRITTLLFYFCLIVLFGIVYFPIFSGQTQLFDTELHPLSYYKFENNVIDNGILRNTGKILGDPSYVEEGEKGKSFEFTGTNSIIIPNDQDYNFEKNHPFSVSFWMKPIFDPHEDAIINKLPWIAGSQGWRITLVPNQVLFEITDKALKDDIVLPCTGFSYNKWHNFVFTYDGNGVSGGMTCYIDNRLVASGGGGNLTSSISNDVNLTIGADPTGHSNFKGQMTDLMIFNENISRDTINFLYYGFFQPNVIYTILLLIFVIVLIIFRKEKYAEKENKV